MASRLGMGVRLNEYAGHGWIEAIEAALQELEQSFI